MKKDYQNMLFPYIYPLPKLKTPIFLIFEWHEKTHKRDLDNIAFGKKFILDSLVQFGKIENDNIKNVKGFKDLFLYDSQDFVKIEILENVTNGVKNE